MTTLLWTGLTLVVLLLPQACVGADIVELSASDWDAVALDPTRHVFVQFYTPWCGQCRHMAPAWVELATSIGNSDVVIGMLNAHKHEDVARRYGVEGLPEMLFFHKLAKDRPIVYSGGRSVKAFQSFLIEQMRPRKAP